MTRPSVRFAFVATGIALALATTPGDGGPPPVPATPREGEVAGLDPTGKADCSGAIQAMLDAGAGKVVRLPAGTYRCASTLAIRTPADFVGATTGSRYGASWLVFDDGVGGIVVEDNPAAASAQGITLANLCLKAAARTKPDADGITLHAGITIRDCWIEGFSGHGILVDGAGHAANEWAISGVTTARNGGDGLHVQGNDANAGTCIGLSSWENGGAGWRDSSFLGNFGFGIHTRSNKGGGYVITGGVNRSVLVGCYSEADQPPSRLGAMVHVFGGVHDPGLIGGQVFTAGQGHARFQADHAEASPLEAMGRANMSVPAFLVRDRNTTPVAGISEGGTFGSWFAPGSNRPGDDTRLDLWAAPTDTSLMRIGAINRNGYTASIGRWTVGADGPSLGQGWHALTTYDASGKELESVRMQAGGVTVGKGGLRLAPTSAADRAGLTAPGTIVGDEDGSPLVRTAAGAWVPLAPTPR